MTTKNWGLIPVLCLIATGWFSSISHKSKYILSPQEIDITNKIILLNFSSLPSGRAVMSLVQVNQLWSK